MKHILLVALLLPAFSVAAQTTSDKAAAPSLTTIEPQALSLLSRTAQHYRRARFYRGVSQTSWREENPDPVPIPPRFAPETSRFRVLVTEGGLGVITKNGLESTVKTVSDGTNRLITDTRYPRQYIRDQIWPSYKARDKFRLLRDAGLQGIVMSLLDGTVGGLLLDPNLLSLTMGTRVNQNGVKLQAIVMEHQQGGGTFIGRITLYVADDLTLHSAEGREFMPANHIVVWKETHSEIEVGHSFPADLMDKVSTSPPRGSHPVEIFSNSPLTQTPAPAKSAPRPPVRNKK